METATAQWSEGRGRRPEMPRPTAVRRSRRGRPGAPFRSSDPQPTNSGKRHSTRQCFRVETALSHSKQRAGGQVTRQFSRGSRSPIFRFPSSNLASIISGTGDSHCQVFFARKSLKTNDCNPQRLPILGNRFFQPITGHHLRIAHKEKR